MAAFNVDDVHDLLSYELANFVARFSYFKAQAQPTTYDTIMQQQQKANEDETETESESEVDELQEQLDNANRKLDEAKAKNQALNQDVTDLNALIGLYFKEAQRRDMLEEEWREKVTAELKDSVRNLRGQLFSKIGEVNNLANTVIELQKELRGRDEALSKKDEEIELLQRKLISHTSNAAEKTSLVKEACKDEE